MDDANRHEVQADPGEVVWVPVRAGRSRHTLELLAGALLRGDGSAPAAGRAALDRLLLQAGASPDVVAALDRAFAVEDVTVPLLVAPGGRLRPAPARAAGSLQGAVEAWHDGRLDEAVRETRRAVASAGDGRAEERARSLLAVVLTDAGSLSEASEVARGHDATPDRSRERLVAAVTARRLLGDGRLDEAVRLARCCLRPATDSDPGPLVPLALSTVATATLRRGDLAATAALLRSRPLDGVAAPLTARLTWLDGQVAEAREGPVRAVELLAGLYDRPAAHRLLLAQEPAAAGWLVRTALAAGHRGRGEAIAGSAAALASATPGPAAASAAHAEGLLADDCAALQRAVDGHRDRWARASAAEDLAVALGAGQAVERNLVEVLDAALADYQGCGAERDAARVRARLRTLGVRRTHWQRRDRPASGWASLTETERTVARLVTEGSPIGRSPAGCSCRRTRFRSTCGTSSASWTSVPGWTSPGSAWGIPKPTPPTRPDQGPAGSSPAAPGMSSECQGGGGEVVVAEPAPPVPLALPASAASTQLRSAWTGAAPACRATAWPRCISRRVGTARTSKRSDSFGVSSTFTLTSLTRPAYSRAICSSAGLTIRHGPHQGAHRSTSTGILEPSTTSAKSSSPASAIHGSG